MTRKSIKNFNPNINIVSGVVIDEPIGDINNNRLQVEFYS
jgi:hypothetical protein